MDSYGYDGFISPAPVWGNLQDALNQRYFCGGPADCAVTPNTSAAYQVQVAPGNFGGVGILNTLTAIEYVDVPEPPSGTKWYLVVGRQDFLGLATTLVAIDCGTNQYTAHDRTVPLPAINANTAGLYDVPLALVPVTAGAGVPGDPIDLRLLGPTSGNYEAADEKVLLYVAQPGVRIGIGDYTWRRRVNGANVVWEKCPQQLTGILWSGGQVAAPIGGWSMGGVLQEAYDDNGEVDLYVELRRTGGAISLTDQQGNLADMVVALLARLRPVRPVVGQFEYRSSSGASYVGGMSLEPSGNAVFKSGAPGTTIRKTIGTGTWDARFTAHYNVRRFAA